MNSTFQLDSDARRKPHASQAAEKVFRAREMAKFGGSKMYPRGSPNAYSASNRVRDFELGIDKDFFRSLVSLGFVRVPVRTPS
jgi:hypothetical protein